MQEHSIAPTPLPTTLARRKAIERSRWQRISNLATLLQSRYELTSHTHTTEYAMAIATKALAQRALQEL